jgi:hypothetical protein
MSDMDTTPGFFGKIKKDPIPAIGELNFTLQNSFYDCKRDKIFLI